MVTRFWRRKTAEGDGNEQKHYVKANLGEKNKLYFNKELGRWVEKGKEEEARAELAALAAPPPAPAAVAPAADVAAPNGDGQSPVPPAGPKYNRGFSIKDRYIATPVGGVGGSGPPSGKGLLPGAAAGGLVPGLPKPAGGGLVPGVGSFYMPTPTASEAPSEPAADSSTPGTMSMSQSGVSIDGLVPGSGPPSQPGPFMPGNGSGPYGLPGFFVPSMPAAATAEESSGSSAPAVEDSSTANAAQGQANGHGAAYDHSSGGGVAPAAGSSQNLSFASWGSSNSNRSPYRQPSSTYQQQHAPPTSSVDAEMSYPAKQQKHFREQHPRSPRSPQVQGPFTEANGNGSQAVPSEHAGNGLAGEDSFALAAGGGDAAGAGGAQANVFGGGWNLGPARDPLDLSAGIDTAVSGAATPSAWAGNQQTAASAADPEGGGDEAFGSWQPGAAAAEQQAPTVAAAAAETGWGGAGTSLEWPADNHNAESAAALGPSADGYTVDGYVQQASWGQQGDAQQAYGQYAGYGHTNNEEQQQWQGYLQRQPAADQQQHANGYGHYGENGNQYFGYQQPGTHGQWADGSAAASGQHEAQQQPLPVVLDPVHPELPGIATTLGASGSEEFALLSSHQQPGPVPAAAAVAFVDAASRYQSAPGSAPHPSRATSGGLHGSYGSGLAPARSTSLHSPPKGSIASLLPPARPSFNGSAGSPPKDSSALTLPATAVAGDSSLMTTVRPSSPYARPVSPLARTNTGMSDLSTDNKVAAQGFPIPSPPTAGLGKPGMFVPGVSCGQQCENQTPWRPSAPGADTTAGGSYNSWQPSNQPQQHEGLTTPLLTVNGYVGPHYATANGPAAANSSKEPWVPTGDKPNPAYSAQDAAGRVKQSKRVHYYDEFLQDSIAEVNWKLHPFEQPGKLNKLTPFEQFEQEQERRKHQHNTKNKAKADNAFYLKQMKVRQKLPAGAKPSMSEPVFLPSYVAAQMGPSDSAVSDASRQQHQQHFGQQQQHGAGEPVTPKRAKSEGAAMHAAQAGSPEETTPESKFMPSGADKEAESFSAAAAAGAVQQQLLAPAAAVIDGHAQSGNSYGVYDPLNLEQGVPAAGAAAPGAAPAEAAAAAAEAGVAAEHTQQEGDTSSAAAWPALWSLCTPEMQQAWVQWCYPDYLACMENPEYQSWFAQQYDVCMAQQQQQEQQVAKEQVCEQLVAEQQPGGGHVQQEASDQSAAAGVADSQQAPQQLDGWGTPEVSPGKDGMGHTAAAPWDAEGAASAAPAAGDDAPVELGQPTGDAGVLAAVEAAAATATALAQQLDEQAAAALEAVADGWGVEDSVLDTLAMPAEALAADAGDSLLAATAVAAAAAAVTAEDMFEQAVASNARVTSSTGGASQPSTAKAAAAASKAIVSQALDKIIREHADSEAVSSNEQVAGHTDAATAAVDGWGEGWAEKEVDLGVLAQTSAIAAAVAAAAAGMEPEAAEDALDTAATEAATAAVEGWGDGWGDAVAAAADIAGVAADAVEGQDEVQQVQYDATPEYPLDWLDMRASVAAVPDPDGQLSECKQAFIGWGDAFFGSAGGMWASPSQRHAADSVTAAALADKTAELDQAIEMFSELQLQHRMLSSIFSNHGFDIEDLLSSLEV